MDAVRNESDDISISDAVKEFIDCVEDNQLIDSSTTKKKKKKARTGSTNRYRSWLHEPEEYTVVVINLQDCV